MDAERELIDVCALSAKIEDTDLRVRYTTVESGLWVWLERRNQHLLCQGWERCNLTLQEDP